MKKHWYMILAIVGAIILYLCLVPVIPYTKWAVTSYVGMHVSNCTERKGTIPEIAHQYILSRKWTWNDGKTPILSLKDYFSPCVISPGDGAGAPLPVVP